MAETKPIPVRLPEIVISRLDRAADKMGNTRAGLIRMCIELLLTHFEKHGFSGLDDLHQMMAELDGRTREAKSRNLQAGGVSSDFVDQASQAEARLNLALNDKGAALPDAEVSAPSGRKSLQRPGTAVRYKIKRKERHS